MRTDRADVTRTYFFSTEGTRVPGVFDPAGYWRIYPVVSGGDGTDDDPAKTGDATGGGDDADKSKSDDTTPGGTGDDTQAGGEKDDKTFTQDDLNKIVAREVEKAKRGKLDPKELQFESRKDLEAFVENQRKALEDQKTEDQKALEEAKKQAAEEAKSSVLSEANKRIIRAEFVLAATKAGVKYVDDAFLLAPGLESFNVEVDDEGKVSGLTDEFFEELKESKPFLWGEEDEGAAGDIGAGAGAGGKKKKALNREQELRQRYPALRAWGGQE